MRYPYFIHAFIIIVIEISLGQPDESWCQVGNVIYESFRCMFNVCQTF